MVVSVDDGMALKKGFVVKLMNLIE